MKEEIKRRWVEALRSGEFEQGRERLLTVGRKGEPDRFCCLGVLCELYLDDHPEHPGWDEWGNLDGEVGSLPKAVIYWADYAGHDPRDPLRRAATYWNDVDLLTFDEIADRVAELPVTEEGVLLKGEA